jgi:hypothetical protein
MNGSKILVNMRSLSSHENVFGWLLASFDRRRKDKLLEIATNEIENHGFHRAKVNMSVLKGQSEYVLCLYYKDDSRKYELAERNKQEYGVKYRYWKSDEATLRGRYSKEFLEKLSKSDRRYFTKDKIKNSAKNS